MTQADLKNHPLYRLLAPREQLFLLEYAANGKDVEAAVKAAYPNATPWRMIRKLQGRQTVYRLMTMIDGQYVPSKDEVIHSAWIEAQTAQSEAVRERSRELVARLAGYVDDGEAAEKQRQAVLKTITR